ncbi:MAG: putative peptidoglycan glycosyltransferase FtsW [bacterium]|nr:putative peptidoglycan glycosyltransferase FtsW [bacterium]
MKLGLREPAFQHGDRIFIATLGLLSIFGLVMIYSSSSYMAFQSHGDPYYYLKEHLLRLGLGLALFLIAYNFDYHHLRRVSLVPWLITLVGLVIALALRSRWLSIFGISLQPSEFARIALIIFLADWCSRHAKRLQSTWKGFAFAISIILITVALVVIEPSYSASAMIFLSAGLVVLMAGAKWAHVSAMVVPLIPIAAVVAVAAPYRLQRVMAFFNPLADPKGAGYQSLQSLIAVGSGQIIGKGPGMSGQKFQFLPEAHCDFIFSILCEEWGFIGGGILLALFLTFLVRGVRIALRAPDQFGFLLAGGLVLSIALFAFINIAVSLAILPVTGLPLPFVSYGGSALLANMIACGLILNVSRHTDSPEAI